MDVYGSFPSTAPDVAVPPATRRSSDKAAVGRRAFVGLVTFAAAAASLGFLSARGSSTSAQTGLDVVQGGTAPSSDSGSRAPSSFSIPTTGSAPSSVSGPPHPSHVPHAATSHLDFNITSEYTRMYGATAMGYPFIDAYKLVEPYRMSTFELQSSSSECTYDWTITNGDDLLLETTGEAFETMFNETGTFKVHIAASGKSPACSNVTATKKIRSRYVRRELRSLTSSDLSEWFDTVEVIYKTSCSEGKKKYGSHFKCIDELTKYHNELAGDTSCDHMHDGYGFLTQHTALTRWFEIVLRAVNPKTTAHYWDYTIEGEQSNMTQDISHWRNSIMFDDDKFGNANTNGIITTGRFAYTPALQVAQNFTTSYNAYGYMRAPWNQNPLPYVTRYNTTYGINFKAVPGCHSHQKILKETTWMVFGKDIAYGPHGTTHMMIGGIGHADMATELKGMGYDMETAREWVPTAFAFQKNMFRAGILQCPKTCSVDTPTADCKCTCPDIAFYTNMTDENLWSSLLFKILATDYDYALNKTGHFVGREILNMLCNNYDRMSPVMGDSLESASPSDVSFWPTHPTVERLLTWRRINGFDDLNWPMNMAWSVDGFMTSYCSGHNKLDVLTWPNYIYEPAKTGPYTNADVWDVTDPTSENLDYVYDTFEWSHCSSRGYPAALIETSITTSA